MANKRNRGTPRIFLFLILFGLGFVLGACLEEEGGQLSGGGFNSFSGIQTNLPESQVTSGGWNLCYSDDFNTTGVALSGIFSGCGGSQFLLACRPIGNANLIVAAHAPFADVTFDTGINTTITHVANGVAWYFNNNHSWGFIEPGDSISKNSCDTDVGAFDDRKMCWHTGAGTINVGYRCGTDQSLNGSTTWERLIYTDL